MEDRRPFDHGQRGAVMVLVLVILLALLAGGAVLLRLQLGSTRQTGVASDKRAALYCAEAGLTAARAVIVNNYADWSLILDADVGNDPAWYPVTGDLDGDGTADFAARLRDNDDEPAPAPNDPAVDADLAVFVVSRCTAYPETPREVIELVRYAGGGKLYGNQAQGGAWNTGNQNP